MNERDPVKRLHNLCDFLDKQKDQSPYDRQSWDELENENARLRREVAIRRKELETLKKLHEKCASEFFDLQQDYKKLDAINNEITELYLKTDDKPLVIPDVSDVDQLNYVLKL